MPYQPQPHPPACPMGCSHPGLARELPDRLHFVGWIDVLYERPIKSLLLTAFGLVALRTANEDSFHVAVPFFFFLLYSVLPRRRCLEENTGGLSREWGNVARKKIELWMDCGRLIVSKRFFSFLGNFSGCLTQAWTSKFIGMSRFHCWSF